MESLVMSKPLAVRVYGMEQWLVVVATGDKKVAIVTRWSAQGAIADAQRLVAKLKANGG